MKIQFKKFSVEKGTFTLILYNKQDESMNGYFVQFSLVDMWLLPHKQYLFNSDNWIAGWLFFYFGNIKKINKTGETSIMKDNVKNFIKTFLILNGVITGLIILALIGVIICLL